MKDHNLPSTEFTAEVCDKKKVLAKADASIVPKIRAQIFPGSARRKKAKVGICLIKE